MNSAGSDNKPKKKYNYLTSEQKLTLIDLIDRAYANKDIGRIFVNTYPTEKYRLATEKSKHQFYHHIDYYRKILEKRKNGKYNVTTQRVRLNLINNLQSHLLYKLEHNQLDDEMYLKYNTLLLKHLEQVGKETGDLKTGTNVNIDARKQLQQNIFSGRALVETLTQDDMNKLQSDNRDRTDYIAALRESNIDTSTQDIVGEQTEQEDDVS